MEEKYQSEWSRELPLKEQLTIVLSAFVSFCQTVSTHVLHSYSLCIWLTNYQYSFA